MVQRFEEYRGCNYLHETRTFRRQRLDVVFINTIFSEDVSRCQSRGIRNLFMFSMALMFHTTCRILSFNRVSDFDDAIIAPVVLEHQQHFENRLDIHE